MKQDDRFEGVVKGSVDAFVVRLKRLVKSSGSTCLGCEKYSVCGEVKLMMVCLLDLLPHYFVYKAMVEDGMGIDLGLGDLVYRVYALNSGGMSREEYVLLLLSKSVVLQCLVRNDN